VLNGWGLSVLVEPAVLVLSELMTNSVQHARSPRTYPIETRYVRGVSEIRIEVHDAGGGRPEPRTAAVDDETGRGLTLVEVLTGGRWGVSGNGSAGKTVWAFIGTG
jgi:anti-sigma regulatory factor (Ser/Thr protein kinase)